MKKIVALILIFSLLMTVFVFTGCSKKKSSKKTESTEVTEDITPTTSEDIEETTETTATETEIDTYGDGRYTYQVGDVNLSISVDIYEYIDEDNKLHYADIFRDLGWEVYDGNIWRYDDLDFYFYINTESNISVMDHIYYHKTDENGVHIISGVVLVPNRDTYVSLNGDFFPIEGIVLAVFICEHLVDNPNVDPLEGVLELYNGGYGIN